MKRNPELVFVSGAGSGIGRATARRFARMGAVAIATDINIDTARETAELIHREGGSAHAYRLDVSDAVAFEELAERIRVEHGVPDVAVNNAGMMLGGTFLEHSMQDWHRMLGVHLMGVVHGSRLFGAQMAERGRGGHLVNVSSVASFSSAPYCASYCTSKSAIRMLSESLHAELATSGIGVSAMCFGLINTNIGDSAELLELSGETADTGKSLVSALMNMLGSDPDYAAKMIVSAVRRNRVVVPVRPEAYALYALSRATPGLLRGVMTVAARVGSKPNLERLGRIGARHKPAIESLAS
ncbi:SDR family NAD(P)-dependent oxidoreductase [Nocardia uniformis]|uniref:SDR family NAD(P)-dependent oxidoreductase n=1 Tax=Nocardia uniformis TaxID=53432 RepID=A0A849C3L3_9NOCA|nr:SDR family NAD(P)-dependent oxidoreductase [Nocardia uniformis]NNH70925.1 SDR family NAD(P)-dependent oxidoreductase [Nocardia uniformis]